MTRLSFGLALVVATVVGCVLPPLDGALVRCEGDVDCPSPQVCVTGDAGDSLCRAPGDPCIAVIDGVSRQQPDGTACAGGICVANACVAPRCGDGVITAPEACDDGAANSDTANDTCRSDCQPARCGDGVLDSGESCDEGAANSDTGPDACRTTCERPACGDGVIDAAEICDDGAANSDRLPNACRSGCVPASCGDNVRDLDEECDEGDGNDDEAPDTCRTNCRRARCGDDALDTGEVCDDGELLVPGGVLRSGDGCRADCGKIEACGDAQPDEGEACDDGNDNPRDGCDACRRAGWDVEVLARGRALGDALALTGPLGVAVDVTGAVYIADTGGHRVLRVDAAGTTVIAGTGVAGFSGDDGPATAAKLRGPTDVAVASNGDVYIADRLNNRVRRVTPGNGVIRTFAGGNNPSDDGDGGPAPSARLRRPRGVAFFDDSLLIAEEEGGRIRRVAFSGQNIIQTIVGSAISSVPLADGPFLTTGRLAAPVDAAALDNQRFVLTDGGGRVRLVDTVQGTISTLAGGALDGTPPGPIDVDATAVLLEQPGGLLVDETRVFVTDAGTGRVLRIDLEPPTPQIRVVVGSGQPGVLADGTDPLAASLGRPVGVTGFGGRLYFADEVHHVVREVDATGISTLVGTGRAGVNTEGALATTVTLDEPVAVVADGLGGHYIADRSARRVFHRSAVGYLRTVAGTGAAGGPEDGAAADTTPVTPVALAVRPDGRLVISTEAGKRRSVVCEVDAAGTLSIMAEFSGVSLGRTEPLDIFPIDVDALGRVVVAGFGFVAIETGALGSAIPGFTIFDLPPDEIPTAIESLSADRVVLGGDASLTAVDLDFSAGVATTVKLASGAGSARGLAHVDESMLLVATPFGVEALRERESGGAWLDGDEERFTFILAQDVPGADGLFLQEATVVVPAGIALDVDGALLIADVGSDVVRRLELEAGGIIETMAGDLHPPGPGLLPDAALYGPRILVPLGDGSLLAGGLEGRLLRVVVDGVRRVEVVAGHPFPGPERGGLLPLRFAPLAADDVVLVPGASSGGVHVIGSGSRRPVNVAGPPATWVFDADQEVRGGTVGIRAGLELPDGRVAVSNRTRDCVHFHPVPLLPGPIETLFGRCDFEGAFDGLVRDPGGLARSPSGALYLADTGNNRVLRRDLDGTTTVVIGDGSSSSAGQGRPARDLPLQAPAHVAVDRFGNLFVSSTTTVRMVANIDGDADADGDDEVITIFGAPPRTGFPESESRCLEGLALDDNRDHVYVADACSSFLVRLTAARSP